MSTHWLEILKASASVSFSINKCTFWAKITNHNTEPIVQWTITLLVSFFLLLESLFPSKLFISQVILMAPRVMCSHQRTAGDEASSSRPLTLVSASCAASTWPRLEVKRRFSATAAQWQRTEKRRLLKEETSKCKSEGCAQVGKKANKQKLSNWQWCRHYLSRPTVLTWSASAVLWSELFASHSDLQREERRTSSSPGEHNANPTQNNFPEVMNRSQAKFPTLQTQTRNHKAMWRPTQ